MAPQTGAEGGMKGEGQLRGRAEKGPSKMVPVTHGCPQGRVQGRGG